MGFMAGVWSTHAMTHVPWRGSGTISLSHSQLESGIDLLCDRPRFHKGPWERIIFYVYYVFCNTKLHCNVIACVQARDVGSAQNKWLLVNVQNVEEFSCQMLNRDVWSHADARKIIADSFLFWQVSVPLLMLLTSYVFCIVCELYCSFTS